MGGPLCDFTSTFSLEVTFSVCSTSDFFPPVIALSIVTDGACAITINPEFWLRT